MPSETLEVIATLITEIGQCYQRGRRYRAIAARCEDRYLARALEIGGLARRAQRTGGLDAGAAWRLAESLRALRVECEAAITEVRSSELYRRAAAAWREGRSADVVVLAPTIFAAVEVFPNCPTLYYPVPITSPRRGGGDHFIPPATCADAIAALGRSGIMPNETPPDLAADESIGAILLSDDPDAAESPVTLAIEPSALGFPVCRIVPAGEAVIYAPRVSSPWRVRFTEVVSDEWWAVRPDAYADYARRLRAELRSRSVPLVGETR